MTPEEFQSITGVSRETRDRMVLYHHLLLEWRQGINLVGKSTLENAWERHFLDSAQLLPLLPAGARVLVDMGSGAGFPGLVLSAMGFPEVHVIESDGRKAGFLSEVVRQCGLNARVHNARVEAVTGLKADVVTARAMASVVDLLGYALPFIQDSGGICIFPKGKSSAEEIEMARKRWVFHVEHHPSQTSPEGDILVIKDAILRTRDEGYSQKK